MQAAASIQNPLQGLVSEKRDICQQYIVNRSQRLGEGAFADVYSAKCKMTKQTVAIKEFRVFDDMSSLEEQAAMMEACVQEFDAMHQVRTAAGDSPFVLNLINHFDANSELCLPDGSGREYRAAVLPLAHGDLFDAMEACANNGSAITYATVAKALVEALSGLRAMHEGGMVHRDIKLENLLLMKDQKAREFVVVADFGFAQHVDSTGGVESDPFNVVGTLNALSPEVFTHNFYSPKSDVWALASAFYTLCFQQYPVNPDSTRTLYRKLCRGGDANRLRRTMATHVGQSAVDALDQLSSCHSDPQGKLFVDFLRKTLCLDPMARLSAAQALVHPFLVEYTAKQGMQKALTNSSDLKKFKNRHRLRAAAKAVGGGRYAALLTKLKRQLGDVELPPLRLASIQSAFIAGLQSPSRMSSLARETSAAGAAASLPQIADVDEVLLTENADRGLTKQQFKTVIRALNLKGVNADNLFRIFDTDKNGSIDYKEFVSGIAMVQGPSEAALEIAFNAFDLDGNGTLDPTELSHVVSMLDTGSKSKNEDLKDRLEKAFVALDEDGDGQVSWEEFKNGLERDPFLAEVLLGHLQTATADRLSRRSSSRLSQSDQDLLKAATSAKNEHLQQPMEDFDTPPPTGNACCLIM